MSTPVHFCSLLSMSFEFIGNTLPQQSFHLFGGSIPEMSVLSPDVHPRPQLSIQGVPDGR